MKFFRNSSFGCPVIRSFLIVVTILLLGACAKEVGKGQALTQLDRLETGLTRGASKKSDVLFLLGEPDGSGGALFPTASSPNDIWYYEATKASLSNLDQRVLLIYFEEDLYAGYQWFTNKAEIEMQ